MSALRDSLLWGVVGGLSFLVLLQGYELVSGTRVTVAVKAGVALIVVAGATLLSYAVRDHLPGNESP